MVAIPPQAAHDAILKPVVSEKELALSDAVSQYTFVSG